MSEKTRGSEYALKRAQAGQNAETKVAKVLYTIANEILTESKTYRASGGGIAREAALVSKAGDIAEKYSDTIESYMTSYSQAACKTLGISTEVVDEYLAGRIYGKTFTARNTTYLRNFAEDVVRMIKAGALLGYSDDKILSAIRSGYKDPYKASVITKAKKDDVNIDVPSYGKGFYKSSYQNLARNIRGTIALAWGQAEQEYGKQSGAIGFRVFRGSSYPCPQCDEETTYIHKFGDPFPPLHNSCVCGVEFVYENKEEQ